MKNVPAARSFEAIRAERGRVLTAQKNVWEALWTFCGSCQRSYFNNVVACLLGLTKFPKCKDRSCEICKSVDEYGAILRERIRIDREYSRAYKVANRSAKARCGDR